VSKHRQQRITATKFEPWFLIVLGIVAVIGATLGALLF
jgi:hypothetical protein